MSDKKQWITKLVPALAFAAGIIITSVGGIMVTSSSLKLAVFDTEPYSYITKESCRYNYSVPTLSGDYLPQTSKDILSCVEERKQEEKNRFQNEQQEDIIDGLSALIVGGILLLAFRKRK
jgi:hypothetical protein